MIYWILKCKFESASLGRLGLFQSKNVLYKLSDMVYASYSAIATILYSIFY